MDLDLNPSPGAALHCFCLLLPNAVFPKETQALHSALKISSMNLSFFPVVLQNFLVLEVIQWSLYIYAICGEERISYI